MAPNSSGFDRRGRFPVDPAPVLRRRMETAMHKSRLLVLLVVADVLLSFASVGAEAFFGWTLPPPLAEYSRVRFSRVPGVGDVIPLLLLVTCVLSAFAGWIGLLTYWRFGRRF